MRVTHNCNQRTVEEVAFRQDELAVQVRYQVYTSSTVLTIQVSCSQPINNSDSFRVQDMARK